MNAPSALISSLGLTPESHGEHGHLYLLLLVMSQHEVAPTRGFAAAEVLHRLGPDGRRSHAGQAVARLLASHANTLPVT